MAFPIPLFYTTSAPFVPDVYGYWQIVVPEETTNYVLNPSAETSGNVTDIGAFASILQSASASWSGLFSWRCQTTAINAWVQWTLGTLPNAIHYVTVRSFNGPPEFEFSLDNITFRELELIETYDDEWALYGAEFTSGEANGSTSLRAQQQTASNITVFLDSLQVETKSYWTTFCGADQPGCTTNGLPHASTTTRSALSRAGGRVRDLGVDFGFRIVEMIDSGMPVVSNITDTYALKAGGQVQGNKVNERTFTLLGKFFGSSLSNLNSLRQDLINVVKPNAVPETAAGPQPFKLRYTGADVIKEISVHYEGGLEARITGRFVCAELIPLRLYADDPYFYEIGNSSQQLDIRDTASLQIVAARLSSTGQWDALGPPNALGTYTEIRATTIGPDKTVYYGGDFLNFDNDASADYITSYNQFTGTWANLGAANDVVRVLRTAPNGYLWAGGDFTSIGGVAANGIAFWNGTVWAAVGAGLTGGLNPGAYDIAIAPNGDAYTTGNFTTAGGGAAANVAYWDGAAWNAMGAGLNSGGRAISIPQQDVVYVGGSFTSPANYIALWNGSAWSAFADEPNNDVLALTSNDANNLYASGNFTDIGNYIALWNGQQWLELGDGLDNPARVMDIAPDSTLWVAGSFTTAGSIVLADRIARWNGSSWVNVDLDLNGSPSVRGLATGNPDPVVSQIYDVWIGFDSSGIGLAEFSGSADATNRGTERAVPTIFARTTVGEIALKQIRNETTGKTISVNYTILEGERISINMNDLSVTSSYFGNIPGAILPGSDFGTFDLLSGINQITAFADGGLTISAWIEWRNTYWSKD